MMTNHVIIADSSALIALEQISRLELLKELFGTVVVPPAVAKEVASTVSLPSWILIQPLSQPISAFIL